MKIKKDTLINYLKENAIEFSSNGNKIKVIIELPNEIHLIEENFSSDSTRAFMIDYLNRPLKF